MSYNDFILTVNSSSIIILLVMVVVLLTATRFRSVNGYAAAIIVVPNVPVYLYNMSRMLGWHNFSLVMFPISYSVNTLLMPLLWIFAKKTFEKDFRLKYTHLLHLIPGLICLGLSLSLSPEVRMDTILYEVSGKDNWIGDINSIIVFAQMFIYFASIFRFFHRVKKSVRDSVSDAEWMQKEWIMRFEYLFAALFVIVMICYVIWPRTDAWLIQILNVIAMFYLVYNTIAHPVMPATSITPDINKTETNSTTTPPAMSEELMKEICESAINYMNKNKAYLRPDLTLAILAKEINISQRMLSCAINRYLNCNFFEFVNRMRIEEAKRLLLELDVKGYNIDSIYSDCGFRSRSSFYMVFKKITGKTPVAWLKDR